MSIGSRIRGAVETAAILAGLSPATLIALVIGIIVVVGVIAYLIFSGAIWTWLIVGAVAFALYYAWASGALFSLLADMKTNPSKYIPLAVGLIVFGVAFPFYVKPQLYADFAVTLSYKVISPQQGSIIGQLLGAEVDVNSITSNLVAVSSYYGVPFLHRPSFDPKPVDRIGAGYDLAVQIGEKKYIFQLRNVSPLTKLVGGKTTERFFLYSVPITGEPPYRVVLTLYANGVPVWTRVYTVYVK